MDENVLTVGELGGLFSNIEEQAAAGKLEDGMSEKSNISPAAFSNDEIDELMAKGAKRCAMLLADSATERHDKSLQRELAEQAMERAYMLWELDQKSNFISLYRHELDSLVSARKSQRKSDDVFSVSGTRFFNEVLKEHAEFNGIEVTLSDSAVKAIVDEAIESAVFIAKNDGVGGERNEIEERMKDILAERAEKLADGYVKKTQEGVGDQNTFYDRFDRLSEENREEREAALSIQDPTDLNEAQFEHLIGYAMGVVVSSYSGLSRQECYEIGLAALSQAVMTYDADKAKEKGARFGTHLTWQIRAELKRHTRQVVKSNRYEKDAPKDADGEERSELIGLDTESIQSAGGKDEDLTGINIDAARLEKMKLGLRQIRHEMPRIVNHLIDLRFGEIMKDDGTPFKNTEYAEMIGISARRIGEIQAKGLKLIRAKLKRLGYVDIIEDEQMAAEEMSQSDAFLKVHKAMADAEALAATVPPESV